MMECYISPLGLEYYTSCATLSSTVTSYSRRAKKAARIKDLERMQYEKIHIKNVTRNIFGSIRRQYIPRKSSYHKIV